MERYKPLPRMHGTGGPSSPHDGVADRNVSARWVKAARALVAGERHRAIGPCRTVRWIVCVFFACTYPRSDLRRAHVAVGTRECAHKVPARTSGVPTATNARIRSERGGGRRKTADDFSGVLARTARLYIITGTGHSYR